MEKLFVHFGKEETESKKASRNEFLSSLTKKDTYTENGALSNSSTGNILLDDFGTAGSYRDRDMKAVFNDMNALYGEDPINAIRSIFYLRMITRKVKLFDSETELIQKGQGNKDESIKRMLWLAYTHPEVFYKNIWLIPLAGCWKDLWTLMGIDFQEKLDRSKIYELLLKGLYTPSQADLVMKYMPSIRAEKKCKTTRAKTLNMLAKGFRDHIDSKLKGRFLSRNYRRLKAEGKAHTFQQQISEGLYDEIDFNLIPGRALSILTNGKFLDNHNLRRKYLEWIKSKPVAKYTGYVYELAKPVHRAWDLDEVVKHTVNKQFEGLIQLAKKDQGGITGNVWCALDTSMSMSRGVQGQDGITVSLIANSLAVYFASLNEGAFKDYLIMFDTHSRVHKLQGAGFCEKLNTLPSDRMGSTNFQSVIDEIVRIRTQNPGIPVEDYPETLIVVSDMQFDPAGTRWSYPSDKGPALNPKNAYMMQTNYEAAMDKLAAVGLPKIKIVWWKPNGVAGDFPSTMDDEGTYCMSGFDGAIISLLLGGEQTKKADGTPLSMEELMYVAYSQELLEQVKL